MAFEDKLRRNVPLARYSSIGIGGPVDFFLDATSDDDLLDALRWSAQEDKPFLLIGGGSNVLLPDDGFRGLVVRVATRGIEARAVSGNQIELVVAAGEVWDDVVRHAVERDAAGIECLSGIPGFTGATPIQNVGAYGQEVSDTIQSVEAIETATIGKIILPPEECEFAYRSSRFKFRNAGKFIITRVTYRLHVGRKPSLQYVDLTTFFQQQQNENPTLAQVRDAVIAIRKRKAMVLDPDEPNSRSCGSFFTNPIVSLPEFERVKEFARKHGLNETAQEIPAYSEPPDRMKLSAAWLMQHSGFQRGERHGNIGLSEKHILAIVNYGGGTAREVIELMRRIQERVEERFGIHLEPEPVIVK